MFLQQLEPKNQQIVKIHDVAGALPGGIPLADLLDLQRKMAKFLMETCENLGNALVRVGSQREDFNQDFRFWEARRFYVDLGFGNAGGNQVLGILAIDDAEISMEPQHRR